MNKYPEHRAIARIYAFYAMPIKCLIVVGLDLRQFRSNQFESRA